ncbi:MAG: hypothetical protein DSZ10_04190 [Sulfurovum sp.]|nr:MAG: hypothetical protein DSZ10_04190 [Sulfurovum sp.]
MKRIRGWQWLWVLLPIVLFVAVLLSVEDARIVVIALLWRLFFFLKKHIILIVSSFFLVKGKFILSLFLKKLAMISATGLGKRYVVERVISKNIKRHLFDPIRDDLKHLAAYVKEHFKEFPLINRLIALFTFLGSLGIVGKLMGGLLVLKVLIARFWSMILAIVLKVGTGLAYFFTDIFWGSWIAPIVEVLLFTWLLEWLEKIPFLKRIFAAIYASLLTLFETFEDLLERYFHLPVRRILHRFAMGIRGVIYRIIGYEWVNAYRALKQMRQMRPNAHDRLLDKRESYRRKYQRSYRSAHEKLIEKRQVRHLSVQRNDSSPRHRSGRHPRNQTSLLHKSV